MSATLWVIGLLAAIVGLVVGDLVSEEVRGWLDRLPTGVLTLAARRVPPDRRAIHLATWAGELHEILKGAEARPILRLWRGTRFAAGLLRTARSSAGIQFRRRLLLGDPADDLVDTLLASAVATVCTFFTGGLMAMIILAAPGESDSADGWFLGLLAAVVVITSAVTFGWIYLRLTLVAEGVAEGE
jgi:hypothetical protein